MREQGGNSIRKRVVQEASGWGIAVRRYRLSLLLLALLTLAGCAGISGPLNLPQNTAGTSAPSPGDVDSVPAGNSLTSGTGEAESPLLKKTGELALEKYRAARAGISSEAMTHRWSIESQYPLKSGENVILANYTPEGDLKTAQGHRKESYGGKESLTQWFLQETELTLIRDGAAQKTKRSEVTSAPLYDFDALVETILLRYSVSEEGGLYLVRATTQDEAQIRELMEDLGYRREAKTDFQGRLFLEATLASSTGHLQTISYAFANPLEGISDTGQLTFSGWNIPVQVQPAP